MNISIVANPEKYEIKKPLIDLLAWTEKNEVSVYCNHTLSNMVTPNDYQYLNVTKTEQESLVQGDITVALGGDGTMLFAARSLKNIQKPILGINYGRLGFMANTQHENLCRAMDNLKAGNYKIDKRYMLEARTEDGRTYHALNEFLFSKKDSASMIIVEAAFDGYLINKYWADGLIVASPTGSTAYNLSAFGPIVMPKADVLVLTPINPHTLTTRPMILPSDKPLKITVSEQRSEVLFSYDGKLLNIKSYPFSVYIKRSNFTTNLIELPGHNYFETLRSKLMWGKDYREQV